MRPKPLIPIFVMIVELKGVKISGAKIYSLKAKTNGNVPQ
jgi:hypothetical protein